MSFASPSVLVQFASARWLCALWAIAGVGGFLLGAPDARGADSTKTITGFSVDTSVRREVLAFYHSVYGSAEGAKPRPDWTGNVVELVPGSTDVQFGEEVLRRVNFYRALSGVSANLTRSMEKSVGAQEAAVLCSRNGGLSHHPEKEHPDWIGLVQLRRGVEACAKSNLALGVCGPVAVDGQIRDDGESNWQVGHRRWLLSQRLIEIGIGDVPEGLGFPAANAIWVVGGPNAATVDRFVLWPNRGYTPKNLLPSRWSISHPGADFAGATVFMQQGGVPVPVRMTCTSNGPSDSFQGEPTLVWEPGVQQTDGTADLAFSVQVTGILVAGMPREVSYDVVAFDPDVLDEELTVQGSAVVTPKGDTYRFNPIARMDGYELTVARGSTEAWLEGAEDSGSRIATSTAPGYAVLQSRVAHSGTSAFHLTHPGLNAAGFSDQVFQLKRRLVPREDSVLQFYETGRFAEATTTLNAELSADDGLHWEVVWNRTGVGLHSAFFDKGWNPHAIPLGGYQGKAVLVRFNLKSNSGPVAAGTSEEHGFFVDDIVLTKGLELVEERRTLLDPEATGFVLDAATAGARLVSGNRYFLSVAPRMAGHLFPSCPLKAILVGGAPAPSAGGAAVSLPDLRRPR